MKILLVLSCLLAAGCAAPQFTGRQYSFNPTPRPFRPAPRRQFPSARQFQQPRRPFQTAPRQQFQAAPRQQFQAAPRQQFQAAPQQFQPVRQAFQPTPRPYYNRHINTLRDVREDHGNGHFRYEFQTENGINVNAVGTPGSRGQSNIAGGFSFPFPEGGTAQLTYVADEFGYRPESPLIPQPPPLPAHAIEQIRVAEEQRRRGIRWD